jgi:hypothetical protein
MEWAREVARPSAFSIAAEREDGSGLVGSEPRSEETAAARRDECETDAEEQGTPASSERAHSHSTKGCASTSDAT